MRLIALLAAIPDQSFTNLLIIGPRFENEIFYARALGWDKRHISALDLLSYSPLVTPGDMHQMPYAAEQFDCIAVGWTLSYSTDPERAAREISRVLAPDGYVAIGVEVVADDHVQELDDLLGGLSRVQHRSQIAKIFFSLEIVATFEPVEAGDAVFILRKPRKPGSPS